MKSDTSLSKIIGYQILFGLGAGCGAFQAIIDILVTAIPNSIPTRSWTQEHEERFGNKVRYGEALGAITIVVIAEALGGAIGISVGQALFISQLRRDIPEATFILKGGATSFRKTTSGPILEKTLRAFNKALTRGVFVIPTVLGGASLAIAIAVFFIMRPRGGIERLFQPKKKTLRSQQQTAVSFPMIDLGSL